MGRPTRIRASNWPVGGSRTVNRRYWRTGGTRSKHLEPRLHLQRYKSIYNKLQGASTASSTYSKPKARSVAESK